MNKHIVRMLLYIEVGFLTLQRAPVENKLDSGEYYVSPIDESKSWWPQAGEQITFSGANVIQSVSSVLHLLRSDLVMMFALRTYVKDTSLTYSAMMTSQLSDPIPCATSPTGGPNMTETVRQQGSQATFSRY